MFTHAFLGSNDLERSRKFYDPLMEVLGYKNVVPVEAGRLVYAGPQGTFIVAPPLNGEQATGELVNRRVSPAQWADRIQKAADAVAKDSSVKKYTR